MQNQIDVNRMKGEILALKEKLLAERDKKFECDLQIGISGILDIYTAYRIRLAESNVELECLGMIEATLSEYEIVLQQEMKAFEAEQAKRQKEESRLLAKAAKLSPEDPMQADLLAQAADLL